MIAYAENREIHQIGTEHVESNDQITIKRKIKADLLSLDEVNKKTVAILQYPCRISTDLNIGCFIRSGSKQSPTINSKFHLRSLQSRQFTTIQQQFNFNLTDQVRKASKVNKEQKST